MGLEKEAGEDESQGPRVEESGCIPKELDCDSERFWDVPFVTK